MVAPEALARASHGFVVAPAGYGKTELIARAVACGAKHQLVLTHTHAGADALRKRLRRLLVPTERYTVDTIAGFALRYALAFPSTCGIQNEFKPGRSDGWDTIYRATAGLFRSNPIRRIVSATYDGFFVDEYQDCTIHQHAIVLALAEYIPCRVLGDPLQSIFSFGKNVTIDWITDVEAAFPRLGELEEPWRWRKTNPALGIWLHKARVALEQGQPLDLRASPIQFKLLPAEPGKAIAAQVAACHSVSATDEHVAVAIGQWPAQCHRIAEKLGGRYSCIEPIELEDLYKHAEAIQAARGYDRAVAVLAFAEECMTRAKSELIPLLKRASQPRSSKRQVTSKYLTFLQPLLAVAASDDLALVKTALDVLRGFPGAALHRRELFDEMRRSLSEFTNSKYDSLSDAASHARERTRHVGRRLPKCTVGRTLLVKGLEFDHALVLDAGGLDRENLYVALTRGSRSLTILSRHPVVNPKPARQSRESTAAAAVRGGA